MDLIELLEKAAPYEKEILQLELVYFIDTGGQSSYLEALPALLGGPTTSIHVLVLKLNESLEDYPQNSLHLESQMFRDVHSPRFTNLEMIQ